MHPTHSIWGPIQTCTKIADGIWNVSTSSHGVYILSSERVAQMPTALRRGREVLYFEEDNEWCFVVLAFPDYFTKDHQADAVNMCKQQYPTIWEEWTGTVLAPEESAKKREALWYQTHQHDWIVTTAWGNWHRDVRRA